VAAALVTGVSRLDGIAVAAEPDAPEQLLAEGSLAAWSEDDLVDASAPARVVAAAEHAVGPLTALVIVHTESRLGGVLDTTAAEFDRHMAVNARAAMLLSAEFARRFRSERGTGRIVAFTSRALHGELAYGASKAALERVVVAAAEELTPKGITVNAVDPGPTDTGWMSAELYERFSRDDSARPCRPLARRCRARRVPLLAARRLAHRPDPRLRRRRKYRPGGQARARGAQLSEIPASAAR
jgi:3-oxoacyl-[acyl-carrier protein] reductase